MSIVYLAWAAIVGYLCLWLVLPGKEVRLLRIVLSPGVGLGIASFLLFVAYLFWGPSRGGLLGCDAVVTVGLGAACVLLRKQPSTPVSGPDYPASLAGGRVAAGGFFVLLIGAAATFVVLSIDNPYGWADSISRWSSKAKLLYMNDENWRQIFRNPWVLNRDYPLLLPGAIAHGWHFTQTVTPLIPQLIAASFLFGTIGLLYAGICRLRGSVNGWLAGSLAAGSPLLVYHAASQYGDIPSGFFVAACLLAIAIGDREETRFPRWWVAAGLAAGLAVWLKNEGLLFAAALLMSRAAITIVDRQRTRCMREMLPFAMAMTPFVAAAFAIKSWAPANPALAAVGQLGRKPDIAAIANLLTRFFADFSEIGSVLISAPLLLAIYMVLVGVQPHPGNVRTLWAVFLTLLIIAVGQACVLVFYTPNTTEWHTRALLHQWPSIILACFLLARPPGVGAVVEDREAVAVTGQPVRS